MEQPQTSKSAFHQTEHLFVPEGGVVSCPICGSAQTGLYRTDVVDLEYFVIPPRDFAMQKCRDCGSQFLTPRPLESELPPFYPADYHAYNENHSGVARLLVQFRARSRARFYGQLIQSRPGRIFDVGAGDCRHFDELRRFLDLECAGVEIQPEIAAKGRARGYDVVAGTLESADLSGHIGRYDIVSMNHVLEHVVSPRIDARACLRSVAAGRTCHRPVADGHVLGEQDFRAQLGWLSLPEALADTIEVGTRRAPGARRLVVCPDPVGATHSDDDLAAELPCSTRVASSDAERQNTRVRCPPRRRPPFRNGRLVVRPGWHRQLSSAERASVTALSG